VAPAAGPRPENAQRGPGRRGLALRVACEPVTAPRDGGEPGLAGRL
jgi:hypothetical protein